MSVAATKRAFAISCVGFALACTPAATPPATAVDPTLAVPPLADAGPSSAHDGVRFGRVPARVGQRWTVSTRAESRTSDGEQVSRYESDYTAEVLGVDGPAPSRVRLRFDHNANVYQEAGKHTVIHGKTYVVDVVAPFVRDESGAAAPEDEAEKVQDIFPDLGTRARVDEVLPEDAMRIGDARNDLAGAVLRIVHPRAWTLEAGTATLSRVDAGSALFIVSIAAKSRQGLRIAVQGEARIRLRDAHLVSLALQGNYGEGDTTQGTFSLQRSVRDEG